MTTIGVPRERKELETRVSITPDGLRQLLELGHRVFVETGAGVASGFTDEEYRRAGAGIAASLGELWNSAELIVKVKEPHEDEYPFLRPGKAIFSFLHLAGLPGVAEALLKAGMIGVAYELIRDENGSFPLLEPMSEVAGKLAIINGSQHLLSQSGGKGMLLSSVGASGRGTVVIFGAGKAGCAALHHAAALGARCVIFDINEKALSRAEASLPEELRGQVRFALSHDRSLVNDSIAGADLLVMAVLVPGDKAPRLVTQANITTMQAGSVIVDISIDQGGSVEGGQTTSLRDPIHRLGNVLYYGVPNMPAQAPKTSTAALTAAVLPYLKELISPSIADALKRSPTLRMGVMTFGGSCTSEAAAKALGLRYRSLNEML